MALEIERKFLVVDQSFKGAATSVVDMRQGYLSRDADAVVRVRIAGDRAFLTVKTRNRGCVRNEFEYEVPVADADAMLSACRGLVIEKTRYVVPFGGFCWEVDVFHGSLDGVIVAEIEIPEADTQFPLPQFVGEEVTEKSEYYNSNIHLLAKQ